MSPTKASIKVSGDSFSGKKETKRNIFSGALKHVKDFKNRTAYFLRKTLRGWLKKLLTISVSVFDPSTCSIDCMLQELLSLNPLTQLKRSCHLDPKLKTCV